MITPMNIGDKSYYVLISTRSSKLALGIILGIVIKLLGNPVFPVGNNNNHLYIHI